MSMMAESSYGAVLHEIRPEADIAEVSRLTPSRRRHARYAVDLDVSLGSDHNFYAGLAENISAGGIFVATHLLKPVGERIEISIHLREVGSIVRGIGEVCWIREYSEHSDVPPGMGIRFVELEDGARSTITEFLTRRDPLLFDDE